MSYYETRLGEEKVPCRVCGKPILGVTQHRKAAHPEVTHRQWRALGPWQGPATSQRQLKRMTPGVGEVPRG